MKRTAIIGICLLSLLFVGCEKEDICGGNYPYGIIEEVSSFSVYPQPGDFYETDLNMPYGGEWDINLNGTICNLVSNEKENKEKYVQQCLELGFRIDPERDLKALKNVPYKNVDFVVHNHGIIGMNLITESEFDADHPAGSSMGDITTVQFRSITPVLTGESNTYDNVMIRMNELDSTLPDIHPRMGILITHNPDKAGTYVFQHSIYFADGKVLTRRFKRIWLEEHLALDPIQR